VVEVKALACELPTTLGLPLSRLSVADVALHVQRSGLVARISDSTVWRWLHEDAIRPWQHRCWIFPRDPQFQAKAGRILDLYKRCWQGRSLREDEFVISTDEKTSIQARLRAHPSLRTEPGKSRAWRRLGVPGCAGRASRQGVRPLRSNDRHRTFCPPGRSGHEPATVRHRAPRVLGHGQRLVASW